MEGWNVRESQIILGWKREGKEEGLLEARRADLISVLEARFQIAVPSELRNVIEETNDLAMLSQWLRTAATASSLDDFRAALP